MPPKQSSWFRKRLSSSYLSLLASGYETHRLPATCYVQLLLYGMGRYPTGTVIAKYVATYRDTINQQARKRVVETQGYRRISLKHPRVGFCAEFGKLQQTIFRWTQVKKTLHLWLISPIISILLQKFLHCVLMISTFVDWKSTSHCVN